MERLDFYFSANNIGLDCKSNILSVYSPFSDRVGLPLHNIPSPFPSVICCVYPLVDSNQYSDLWS